MGNNRKTNGNRKNNTYKKGQNNKNHDKFTRSEETGKFAKDNAHNDPSWYAYNPQLLVDAASIPYNVMLGSLVDYSTPLTNGASAIPGIMVLSVNTAPGLSTSPTSPVNTAAGNIYAAVRRANSGARNYDSTDLMLYLLAMDQCYAYYSYLTRVYGVAQLYSQVNRYLPDALLSAMGADPTDVKNNLAQLRATINYLATKFSSMYVPNDLPFMRRHMHLYSNVYGDHMGAKSQLFVVTPEAFYRYDAVKYESGGCLEYVHWWIPGETKKTVSDMMAFGNDLIDRIIVDTDMLTMSGDIVKAYGSKAVYLLPTITETYTVIPTYDENFLRQVQNAVAIGVPQTNYAVPNVANGDGRDILQIPVDADDDSGAWWLYFNPCFGIQGQIPEAYSDKYLINQRDDAFTTPTDTMEATRLTTLWDRSYQGLSQDALPAASNFAIAADYLCGFAMLRYTERGLQYVMCPDERVADGALWTTYPFYELPDDFVKFAQQINEMGVISAFDYHPFIIPIIKAEGLATPNRCWPIGDMQCTAFVNYDQMLRMNDVALMSMFRVPFLGTDGT